jgi:hypothetical protein
MNIYHFEVDIVLHQLYHEYLDYKIINENENKAREELNKLIILEFGKNNVEYKAKLKSVEQIEEDDSDDYYTCDLDVWS